LDPLPTAGVQAKLAKLRREILEPKGGGGGGAGEGNGQLKRQTAFVLQLSSSDWPSAPYLTRMHSYEPTHILPAHSNGGSNCASSLEVLHVALDKIKQQLLKLVSLQVLMSTRSEMHV
jgi:hypothetical protein